MRALKKIWDFLNGKKTWIGVILYGAGYLGECSGNLTPEMSKILKDAGLALGAGGVLHKAYKAGERANQ